MIRKRTNQEQREAFEELQQRKKRKLENRTGRTEILNYIENINKEINYK